MLDQLSRYRDFVESPDPVRDRKYRRYFARLRKRFPDLST